MVDTVIDVSRYQAGLKLAPFARAGGLAVIAKASQGITIADPNFADFRIQAAAAKLAFASYHYLTNADPEKQAEWYLKCAAPADGERVVADWEADGVTASEVANFLDAVRIARPDVQLTVYSGASAKAGIDAESSAWLSENTSLWLAQYTTGAPSWPTATWKTWSLWQYTDKGAVPGYAGPIDCSRFHGSNANLLKWFGPAAEPAPAPQPPPLATLTMTITADSDVVLMVNGQRIEIPGA